jgi:hypothetical protein
MSTEAQTKVINVCMKTADEDKDDESSARVKASKT